MERSIAATAAAGRRKPALLCSLVNNVWGGQRNVQLFTNGRLAQTLNGQPALIVRRLVTKASIRTCSRMLWNTLVWRRQPGGGFLAPGGRSADAENYVTLWRFGGVGRLRRAVSRVDETF